MSIKIVKEDITKLDVDAIVNAANRELKRGSGVCGAIFDAANSKELEEELKKFSTPIDTGEAVITNGYNLPANFIIHTAGPIYFDGNHNEEELLYNSYENSLKLAKENNIKSIAFPLLSAGIYGYPLEDASKVAIRAINDFLKEEDMEVYISVLDNNIKKFLDKLV